jgi:hypothetical protein
LAANLPAFQQIRNALEDDIFAQVHFRVIQEVWQPHFSFIAVFENIQPSFFVLSTDMGDTIACETRQERAES